MMKRSTYKAAHRLYRLQHNGWGDRYGRYGDADKLLDAYVALFRGRNWRRDPLLHPAQGSRLWRIRYTVNNRLLLDACDELNAE